MSVIYSENFRIVFRGEGAKAGHEITESLGRDAVPHHHQMYGVKRLAAVLQEDQHSNDNLGVRVGGHWADRPAANKSGLRRWPPSTAEKHSLFVEVLNKMRGVLVERRVRRQNERLNAQLAELLFCKQRCQLDFGGSCIGAASYSGLLCNGQENAGEACDDERSDDRESGLVPLHARGRSKVTATRHAPHVRERERKMLRSGTRACHGGTSLRRQGKHDLKARAAAGRGGGLNAAVVRHDDFLNERET
jgi:hypothetical protein